MPGIDIIHIPGCAADCAHEWGDVERTPWANAAHGPNGQAKNTDAGQKAKFAGRTCHLCGGWCGPLGLEPDPFAYIGHLILCLREWRRLLRPDGTLWVNLGDSYAASGMGGGGSYMQARRDAAWQRRSALNGWRSAPPGLKAKNLLAIPWRFAFAAQADGWYLRSDVIWAKTNPMPESVTDRPTKAHEYIFMLTVSQRYFYDAEAIKEPVTGNAHRRSAWKTPAGWDTSTGQGGHGSFHKNGREQGKRPGVTPKSAPGNGGGMIKANESFHAATAANLVTRRNRRTVWPIAGHPFSGAHFATFPPALVEPMVLASTSAAGCCSQCGKPWERVVERSTTWPERKASGATAGNVGVSVTYQNAVHGNSTSHDLGVTVTTLAWQPACTCNAGAPIPCTILDPFQGTGTTGRVAIQHNRNYIGVDLSDTYLVDLAPERLAVQRVLQGVDL